MGKYLFLCLRSLSTTTMTQIFAASSVATEPSPKWCWPLHGRRRGLLQSILSPVRQSLLRFTLAHAANNPMQSSPHCLQPSKQYMYTSILPPSLLSSIQSPLLFTLSLLSHTICGATYNHCCHPQTVTTLSLLPPTVSVATHAQSLLPPTVSAGTASRICCHPHRHLLSSERDTHTHTHTLYLLASTLYCHSLSVSGHPQSPLHPRCLLPSILTIYSFLSPAFSTAIHSLLPSTLSAHTVSTVIHTVSPSTVSRHPQLLSKLSLLPSTLSLLPVTLSLMTPVYCHPYFLLPSTVMSVLQIIPYDWMYNFVLSFNIQSSLSFVMVKTVSHFQQMNHRRQNTHFLYIHINTCTVVIHLL